MASLRCSAKNSLAATSGNMPVFRNSRATALRGVASPCVMFLCLTRPSSSRYVTSPTQCGLFSTHQWPRDNFKGRSASASLGERLAIPARDGGQPPASRKQGRNRQGKNPLRRKRLPDGVRGSGTRPKRPTRK
ncbi:MAG: hypothetical protein LBS00_06640 [Synergistaceae bacterium]|nr:hypothetical protein [Synergistaceae bacterium]